MNFFTKPLYQSKISRLWRRILVIIFSLSLACPMLLWVILRSIDPHRYWVGAQLFTLCAFIIIFVIGLVLHFATAGSAQIHLYLFDTRDLDEYQQHLRQRAYFWSYVNLGIVAIVLSYVISPKLDAAWSLSAIMLLYVVMPTMVMAWLEPDPIADDVTPESETKEPA